ncbi:hypothetical protein HY639_06165 [Candidatus Woesearchaeota archaeon]|nr:hypothetical protein [Candidatus Woesearchaeota archaeon]
MKRGLQSIALLGILLIMVLVSVSAALAFNQTVVKSIEINGREVFTNNVQSLDVRKGDKLDLSVQLTAPDNEDLKNVEVTARFVYEYSDVEKTADSTSMFDVDAGDTVYKRLSLTVPKEITEQSIDMFVMILDRTTLVQQKVRLHIKGQRHDIGIERVLFTPQKMVQAGSYVIGKVRIENFGQFDEEDLVVSAAIPELGVSDADTIDHLEKQKQVTSEELYLQVPACAKSGVYTVELDVLYDNDRGNAHAEFPLEVVKGQDAGFCAKDKSTDAKYPAVVVPTSVQQISAGEAAVYPVTVYNAGRNAQTYIVSAEAGDWATVKIEPSNVLTIDAGETQTAYVYAAAKAGQSGDKLIGLTVKAGNDVLSTSALKVAVTGSSVQEPVTNAGGETLKKVLEIGLIVLVVLIVLLGLIIGFNKLREEDEDIDEEDEEKKSYY